MKTTTFRGRLIATLVLVAISVAYADILAGGSIYGGSSQDHVICTLYNASGASATITTNQIVQFDRVVLPLVVDTCSTLAAGKSCYIQASIRNNMNHSCTMVVSPSAADVRGVLEMLCRAVTKQTRGGTS